MTEITNRERWLARQLIRNSYELAESEIDEMILEALGEVDVDERHADQLEYESGL